MKTNAQKVAELNILFGNPQGDLSNPNVAAIRKQAKLCVEESSETLTASHPGRIASVQYQSIPSNSELPELDMIQLLDGIGDMLTVGYGLAHVIGVDADAVYQLVHESNMTKFIRSNEEEQPALDYYYGLGFKPEDLYLHGDYPYRSIKVAKTVVINDKEYPEGKFLKNMPVFQEPNFSTLLPGYDPEHAEHLKDLADKLNVGIA